MAIARTLKSYLDERKIDYDTVPHSHTETAMDSATSAHVPPHQMAKAVVLEDEDGWWIIDTGIAIDPTQALWEKIFEQELDGKPIKAVLCTHLHPDHIGMAGWLCEKWRVPLYMTQAEYYQGMTFSRMEKHHYSWTSQQHYCRAGFKPEQIEQMRKHYGGFASIITPTPSASVTSMMV